MFVMTISENLIYKDISVKSHVDQFILVLGIYNEKDPTNLLETKATPERYVILYQDGMDIEEELNVEMDLDEVDEPISFIPVEYLYVAIDQVIELITKFEVKADTKKSRDPDIPFEGHTPQIIIGSSPRVTHSLIAYMNKGLRQKYSEIEPINMMSFYGFPSLDKAQRSMIESLGTEFIMVDHPLAFNYSIYEYAINK